MKKNLRILIVISSLLLISSYFLPIWYISLDAPQYPEGMGMQIYINDIRGEKEHDLKNINALNHYIGMNKIIPDSISELTYMPFIMGALILLGLIAGISGKKILLYIWMIIFFIIGVAGMYDFWQWEYDYGHHLNPDAALKIPGMSYQPPLIGSKQIMNFYATSMPDIAGWIIFAVFAIGLFVVIMTIFKSKKDEAV
ncbi:MAG: hypothetical protein A2X61_12905 [Ignavibacteria bacterium GWB2_35_12]|nr:MAG: hypothetical protein A2X61_12905 [Ignavibacteria bacterium GWB2_35_12]OGU93009.1 MAG: hypothetical protein A2220_15830 [Ignavibacteria bacterium RIFOXYA2_FULL_35_10]OGV22996.1 MAG: hypothetical protein A2475_10375 [Ignavibacteria bacterium RIFOXYC2_FULL_35_21]